MLPPTVPCCLLGALLPPGFLANATDQVGEKFSAEHLHRQRSLSPWKGESLRRSGCKAGAEAGEGAGATRGWALQVKESGPAVGATAGLGQETGAPLALQWLRLLPP